ncbi:MAG TPA: sigma-70 family RNA polymerase sigma factor [Gaiellaceae bacterium]|nr:sigma-70 family RNA polymerase sigma factor [Gaiellaceae bacterium]
MGGRADDVDLVRRCRAGDGEAWNELVERYSRYVHAIVSQGYRLRGPDAEDAFQDVFLRIYDRLGSLRNPEALRPWIAQLTRRVCLDRMTALGREEAAELEDVQAGSVIDELDEAFAVRQALAELSDECQEVLDRFFCRDESYRTIGEALGIPHGTIASRISRCLARLRERFEGRFEGGRESGEVRA